MNSYVLWIILLTWLFVMDCIRTNDNPKFIEKIIKERKKNLSGIFMFIVSYPSIKTVNFFNKKKRKERMSEFIHNHSQLLVWLYIISLIIFAVIMKNL